jgi:hypothetical protein
MWSPDPIRQRLANHLLEAVLSPPHGAPETFETKLPIRDITP